MLDLTGSPVVTISRGQIVFLYSSKTSSKELSIFLSRHSPYYVTLYCSHNFKQDLYGFFFIFLTLIFIE